METLIVIPARYGSTRFPGKPLAEICGIPMLDRVVAMARLAQALLGKEVTDLVVATDDKRIASHCEERKFPFVMTEPTLPSGTDRAFAALKAYGGAVEVVVNLQGDAPFTPPEHIAAVAKAARDTNVDAATPYIQLSWGALDQLRAHKMNTPFSGTTLTSDANGNALWFSKNIIPAIRKEEMLREQSEVSPVRRHVGLYAFRRKSLETYVSLNESPYEQLEGLEQLRFLENGMKIRCVSVQPPFISMPGIDTPEDLALAEALILEHGEPLQEKA